MAGIFINYRHDDTPGVAGRLFDYLALRYSHSELFMDVDAMQPGIDFAKQLEVQVSQCHSVIAVIGPRWLDARDQAGHRRLDSASDYVRIELALALQRNIPVIPVLVDGAVMPAEDELPDDLKPLARRHALELRHTRFPSDADTIMRALEKIVPRSHVPWRYVGSGAALVVIIVLAMLWPIFNAKLHPPAQIAVKPPPLNPMVVTTPTVAPPAPPAPASSSRPMINTNLMGSDYGTAVLSTDDWTECQSRCRADNQCMAWTAVHPGVQGPNARCWLKNTIPEPSANSCCVSGIERQAVATPIQPSLPESLQPRFDINLLGSDYRQFALDTGEWAQCRSACKAESACLAWTFVRPGVQGPRAHCQLKNKIPPPTPNSCCISGIER